MIVKKYYNRAVDFYLELAKYWLEMGLFEQPHKLLKLYEILLDFVKLKHSDDYLVEVMKHDYFLSNQKSPSSVFSMKQEKAFQNLCYEYLRTLEGKSPKQWLKQMKFVSYEFDVVSYIDSGYNMLLKEEKVLMYNYEVEYNVFYKSTYEDVTEYIKE